MTAFVREFHATAQAGAGVQVLVDDLFFDPVCVIFTGVSVADSDTDGGLDLTTCTGFFDGTDGASLGMRDRNTATTTDTARCYGDGIDFVNQSGSFELQGALAFVTDSVRVNWDNAPGVREIHGWVLGGSDVQAKVKHCTKNGTGSDPQTGAEFQPTAALFLTPLFGLSAPPVASESSIIASFGVANSGTVSAGAIGFQSQNGQASSVASRQGVQSGGARVLLCRDAPGTTVILDATITSFDVDGHTLNFATNATANLGYAVLWLRITGGASLWSATVTADTTGGAHTQSIVGLPDRPDAGMFFGVGLTAGSTARNAHGNFSFGFFDEALNQSAAAWRSKDADAAGTTRQGGSITSALYLIDENTGDSLTDVGAVANIGATSLDIVWTPEKNTTAYRWALVGLTGFTTPDTPPPPPTPGEGGGTPPTTIDILDVGPGLVQRSVGFFIDLLDPEGTIIGQVEPMTETAPQIENSITRVVKRTIRNLVISPTDYAAMNPLRDRVRPVIVLANGEQFNMGVFLFGDDTGSLRSFGKIPTTTLADQVHVLHQEIERTVSYKKGTLVTEAVEQQFEQAGIETYVVERSSRVFGEPMAWPVGTSRAVLMNQMLRKIGYHQVYFDRDGVGRAVPAAGIESADDVLRYRQGPSGNVYDGTIVLSEGLMRAPNRYVAVDSGAAGSPLVGIYDVPASAPHSSQNRNLTITRTVRVQGLEDQAAAEEAAYAAAAQDRDAYAWAQFQGPLDPRHDTYDVVDFLGERYREISWSFTLAGGSPMGHDLRKVYTDE